MCRFPSVPLFCLLHGLFIAQVVASGPGLEKNGVVQGQPALFTVDTRKAGKAPLKIYGEDVNGKPIDVKVKDNGDGTYACQYNPKEPIKHTVIVTFGGCNVPKSPFRVCTTQPKTYHTHFVLGLLSTLCKKCSLYQGN